MKISSIQGFENQYKLYRRFLSLNETIMTLGESLRNIGFVRYKPLFSNYNSCIEDFKQQYREEYEKLGFEELNLYGENGEMLFTANKLSTLLHQTKFIIGFLEGELHPDLLAQREKSTIVNVSSFSDAQATARSVAHLQTEITLNALSQAINNTKIEQKIKNELLNDLKELNQLRQPDQSKIKAFSLKLFRKLQEIGENLASEVIYKLLSSKMGEM